MTIRIRQAHPNDTAAVSKLVRTAYAHYVERMGREPTPMTADYARLIEAGEVWVAEQANVIVGILVLEVHPDHLLLENIAVSRDVRGTGLGRRLLEFTESFARQHNLSEIRLYTNEAMTENIAYYPRRGYVETHRAIENGRRRVFFTKHL
ncbi:GNAT family N-acetyltransferase [Nocardia transvalensis]|uniref:GNAT family N-acetyltransferase n=1 Tax=Nocardia transvalensis TaxID=37333 RepID=UPI00189637F3|nr:GNAT family N-acetyltransferase [Nocardia transvalensis]MBF6330507.1 GNAT family N-acetyltransferase [Nocardia transvalensis]